MKVFCVFIIIPLVVLALVVTDPPYGRLKINGTHLTKLDGTPVQLRGMSLYWSEVRWGYDFYNNETIYQLKCFWNANIFRAAMAVMMPWGSGGYMNNSEVEYAKMKAVIEAAIANGVYVLVDWHDSWAHLPDHTAAALQFFSNISATYGQYPHIIYETFNEPAINASWDTIKAYHEKVIGAIRVNDPNNVVVAGTPYYSSNIVAAAKAPLNLTNVAYTYHFYATFAGQWARDQVAEAISLGLPVFVTEYGTVNYTGTGIMNETSTQEWWNFMDENKISYVNWAIDTHDTETSAAILPNTTAATVGQRSQWSPSGVFVNKMLWSKDQGLVCSSG